MNLVVLRRQIGDAEQAKRCARADRQSRRGACSWQPGALECLSNLGVVEKRPEQGLQVWIREALDVSVQLRPQLIDVARGFRDKVSEIELGRVGPANFVECQLEPVLVARNLSAGLDDVAGVKLLCVGNFPHAAFDLSGAVA